MRLLSLLLLTSSLVATLPAAEPAAPDYVRFTETKEGASLDVAVRRFTNEAGVVVDLIGAVHIADKTYYAALNERFKQLDAVLYELVGGPMPPKEAMAERKRDPKLIWIGELHAKMQKALELSSQLEEINYYAPNFVHADMSVEQFEAAREQKGESFLGLMVKAFQVQAGMGDSAMGAKSPGIVRLLEILVSKDSATELKRIVGREFDSMETLIAGLEADGGTVIVTERNRIALEVMDKQIAAGKKKLAIFYGAAHLPVMEKSLLDKGFKPVSTDWLKAWSLPPEPVQPGAPATPAVKPAVPVEKKP